MVIKLNRSILLFVVAYQVLDLLDIGLLYLLDIFSVYQIKQKSHILCHHI